MSSAVFVSDAVRAVQALHADIITHPAFHTLTVREQIDRQAQRLVDADRRGNHADAIEIQLSNALRKPARRPLTLATAREAMAREYGFANWNSAVADGGQMPDVVFEAAVDAVVGGDLDLLTRLLVGDPSLATARSSYGHRATLLHYVAANGVEIVRQTVPANADRITERLLEAGADPTATMPVYDGSYPTLSLLLSSSHPANAGVVSAVVELLNASTDRQGALVH